MAHAVLGAVVAQASGNSGLEGAAGAATSALIGESIKKSLYGDIPVSQLSEEQKQTLVALGSLAAGLAGGLAGGDTAGAVSGAQAGKNELSNNMTSLGLISQMMAQETLNAAAMAEAGKGGANEQAALALTKKVKEGLDAACLKNASCVLLAVVAAQRQSNSNSSQNPNIGKDLTDEQKKEIGGSGSGTPGGWEPQDEENARNQAAETAKKDVEKLGYNSNSVSHIFADKHQMGTLVEQFGSPEAALKEMHKAAQSLAENPGSYQTGSWVTVRVGNSNVSVKGIVINGEFRISTATMRPF